MRNRLLRNGKRLQRRLQSCGLQSCKLRFSACPENATRNPQLFLSFLWRAPVRMCTLYIYKIKIKKIIYYIELRFIGLIGQVNMQWKNENATGLRFLLNLPIFIFGWTDVFDDGVGFWIGQTLFFLHALNLLLVGWMKNATRNPQLSLEIVFFGVLVTYRCNTTKNY